MFKRWKNIRPRPLLINLAVTLAYPAVKAFTSADHRLQVFSDILTIVAVLLLIAGVFYSMLLHGDFDISGFLLRRGVKREDKQSFQAYMDDRKEKREEAFNYPLFLGLCYLVVSAVIAYGFL